MITDEKREVIKALVEQFIEKQPSQNKAAVRLGIASSTLSCIVKNKWELVSDEMWVKIYNKLRPVSGSWNFHETETYKTAFFAIKNAHELQNVVWIVGPAGCGKTTTARKYTEDHKNVFYVLCDTDMTRGDFLRAIAQTLGLSTSGYKIREILQAVINELTLRDMPLLIFDEADKLKDAVFYYFIDLYNKLEDRCGMVFLSTSYIKRRMQTGLGYNKMGYQEFNSRIGRKFFDVLLPSRGDIHTLCRMNGISEKKLIDRVLREAELCDFDLRRIKSLIRVLKDKNEEA